MCLSYKNYAKKFVLLFYSQENKKLKSTCYSLHSWILSELEFEPNYLYSVLTKLAVYKFRHFLMSGISLVATKNPF